MQSRTEKKRFNLSSVIKTPNSAICQQFYIDEVKESISEIKYTDIISITVLSSLFNNLANVLDRVVMEFISIDIEKYRIAHNINSKIILSKMSDYDSIHHFECYLNKFKIRNMFDVFGWGEINNFKQSLETTYPQMRVMINQLCNNFIRNTNILLKRYLDDKELILKSFLKDMKEPSLSNILSTGSDFHKQGQQVCIFEFTDKNSINRKIIYKPSPVLSDAVIVGDLKRLREIDEEYENHQSMSEIINEYFTDKSHQLPTYLILPKLDGSPNDINSHYGYIEFISHIPSTDIDIETIAENNLGENISRIVDRYYKDLLIDLHTSGKRNDNIFNSKESLEEYSYICGKLVAMMQLLGLTDVHCENLIVHNGKPYLIDTETCFSLQSIPSIKQMSCFDRKEGAFNGASRKSKCLYFLHNIKGMQPVWCSLRAANTILLKEDDNTITIDSHPIRNALLAGYTELINEFSKNPSNLVKWFDQNKVKEMRIRFIPKSTCEYATLMYNLFDNSYSKENPEEEYNNIKDELILKNAEAYYQRIYSFQQCQNNFSELRDKDYNLMECMEYYIAQPPLADYCADMSKNLFSEYTSLSIPYFHVLVSSKKVFDAKNEPIPVPEIISHIQDDLIKSNRLTESIPSDIKIKLTLPSSNTDFFPEMPIIMARDRAQTIATNERLRKVMIKEAQLVVPFDTTFHNANHLENYPKTVDSNKQLNAPVPPSINDNDDENNHIKLGK